MFFPITYLRPLFPLPVYVTQPGACFFSALCLMTAPFFLSRLRPGSTTPWVGLFTCGRPPNRFPWSGDFSPVRTPDHATFRSESLACVPQHRGLVFDRRGLAVPPEEPSSLALMRRQSSTAPDGSVVSSPTGTESIFFSYQNSAGSALEFPKKLAYGPLKGWTVYLGCSRARACQSEPPEGAFFRFSVVRAAPRLRDGRSSGPSSLRFFFPSVP